MTTELWLKLIFIKDYLQTERVQGSRGVRKLTQTKTSVVNTQTGTKHPEHGAKNVRAGSRSAGLVAQQAGNGDGQQGDQSGRAARERLHIAQRTPPRAQFQEEYESFRNVVKGRSYRVRVVVDFTFSVDNTAGAIGQQAARSRVRKLMITQKHEHGHSRSSKWQDLLGLTDCLVMVALAKTPVRVPVTFIIST